MRTVLLLAWKSLLLRKLPSLLTALSVALGVMLMVAVILIRGMVDQQFNQTGSGFHLILGAKGSAMQLVLNTLFQIDRPIENIPYLYYELVRQDPRMETVVPIAMGDTTQEGGFRIIGTLPEYFEVPYKPASALEKEQKFRIAGDVLREPWDALIGAEVARVNGWDIGSQFQPVHGVADPEGETHTHDEKFTVMGVLERTGTPADRCVYVHIEGFMMITGHEKPKEEAEKKKKMLEALAGALPVKIEKPKKPKGGHHHEVPDEQKEVTAILVRTKAPFLTLQYAAQTNDGPYAQAASPAFVIGQLMNDIVGNIQLVLSVMIGLTIIVSAIGIFVSLFNSMSERRREIAILRALGAGRNVVLMVILVETMFLCLGGGLFGLLSGHALIAVLEPIIEAKTGLLVNPLAFSRYELLLFPSLFSLSLLIGVIPAITAYRTDVIRALHR